MLRTIKRYLRRRRLRRERIAEQCSLPTYTAGARSGVWTVCPTGLGCGSVVYSFGVGDNIAWELALMKRFGVTVHAFDPTPASVAWIGGQELPARFHFHPLGIAAHDGTLSFRPPRHADGFNCRAIFDGSDAAGMALPVRRLATLMAELGHRRLDVLKMDIEGAEYGVLQDMLAGPPLAQQLLVEFHDHFPGIGLAATVQAVRGLNRAGYRIFHVSDRGHEFSFIQAAERW